MLMDEIVELKKTVARHETEGSYKDSQLMDARNELEKSAAALKNAETKIVTLKSQVSYNHFRLPADLRKADGSTKRLD